MNFSAWASVKHAFGMVKRNIDYAFHISWAWYVILIAFALVGYFFAGYNPIDPAANDLTGASGKPFPIFMVLIMLLSFFAWAMIAVGWHRYCLRQDTNTVGLASTLGYIWKTILISLMFVLGIIVSFVPIFLFSYLVHSVNVSPVLIGVIVLPIYIFAYILMFRMSLVLPAYAVGNTDFGFKSALEATKGYNWAIFLQFLLLILIVVVPAILVGALIGVLSVMGGVVGVVLGMTLNLLFGWFTTLLSLSLLTTNYGFFVEKRDFAA